jgi:hypothetical protein
MEQLSSSAKVLKRVIVDETNDSYFSDLMVDHLELQELMEPLGQQEPLELLVPLEQELWEPLEPWDQ